MKTLLVTSAFLINTFSGVVAAADAAECDRLLRIASDREYASRKPYLFSTPKAAQRPMEKAAEAFDLFASSCSVDRSLNLVGFTVHGRLEKIYASLGDPSSSQKSAALATRYGKLFYNRERTWKDLEAEIAEGDARQRAAMQ